MTEPTTHPSAGDVGMLVVRYGIGVVMLLGGIVLLVVSPAGTAIDGFGMAAGAGLSVLLLNYLYRVSVSSDEDRVREERARDYYDEHGEWPEDEEETPRGRKWVLAPGVVTYEAEQAAKRAAETADETLVSV